MAQKTVVLYPSLGVGHLNPMVDLAKTFLRHGLAVTIAVVDPPNKDAVSAHAMSRLEVANPSITFRRLPIQSSPNKYYSHPVMRTIDALRIANPALRDFLRSLPVVDGIVLDMFCVDALDVATELAIPSYILYTCAAGDLAVVLHLPYHCRTAPCSFKDMGETVLYLPGVPPIRALDMPNTMQDRESDVTRARLHQLARMPEARGILVNSFDWLERKALKALRDGLCMPGRSLPQVYCVGPLVHSSSSGGRGERHPCLDWLDAQPKRSVVFLCFGSLGAFSEVQLIEIARGLENSGYRFMWVVRNPPESKSEFPEPNLEALLPEGFLERTKDKGMTVKNWAPQGEVLRHDAIVAFVTHCGWNSALEAIVSEVPMICWPLYAEQRLNKVHLVEEMKLGVVVEGYEELVSAQELEAKMRLVIESEEGRKLRERMDIAKEMAMEAVKQGGSSDVALAEFFRDLGKENLRNESSSDQVIMS